eukprot:CAMPEP_0176491228 /NCGR_PEP_ID=MMETSP0200_2-20121128/8315_1 /TAXON_ID=947934 /ORGANISM="Chaetoceros sp., Strain GSL56" /LENGTH=523 /DNA_ID=CAMNT_0017888633 /DNA_START=291 /DNA_END=1859 /DNA_ORIENTATION=-
MHLLFCGFHFISFLLLAAVCAEEQRRTFQLKHSKNDRSLPVALTNDKLVTTDLDVTRFLLTDDDNRQSTLCPMGEYPVVFDITTDDKGSDISWELLDVPNYPFDQDLNVVQSSDGNLASNESYKNVFCLPSRCTSDSRNTNYYLFIYHSIPNDGMADYDDLLSPTPSVKVTVDGFVRFAAESPLFNTEDDIGTGLIKLDINNVCCNSGSEYQVNFAFKSDAYSSETSWEIILYEGNILADNYDVILSSIDYSGGLEPDANYGAQICLDINKESKYYLKISDEFGDGWDCGMEVNNFDSGECKPYLKVEVDGEVKYVLKDPGLFGPDGNIQMALNLVQNNEPCIDEPNWIYSKMNGDAKMIITCEIIQALQLQMPFSYDICDNVSDAYFEDKTVYDACCACGGSIDRTVEPSRTPSTLPSLEPSSHPSSYPSTMPSKTPSISPTSQPSDSPSTKPSSAPSRVPSLLPSKLPSTYPTIKPSSVPSRSKGGKGTGSSKKSSNSKGVQRATTNASQGYYIRLFTFAN